MNLKFFHQCSSSADLEKMYKEAYQLFGLAGRSKDHHFRKDVDKEFGYLMELFLDREKEKEEGSIKEPSLDEILQEILELRLSAEVCGKWLWLSDRNAFKHQDYLKQLGFRYAKNKKSWYWRPADCKSFNQDPMPMEYIREKYGSETIPVEP